MEPWAGAVLAKILVLVFIILFIQKRPRGLFPQKGRARRRADARALIARILKGDRGGQVFLLILIAVLIAVPILNGLPADQSGPRISTFTVTLLGKYLTYALLAVAVDLVWGYLGILSLGHAAFFALGGYAMGMYLMRQIGERGVYGHPELPDFMVFLNWQELPWFWYGFDQFWFAALMVLLVPGLLAFVFRLASRSVRVSPGSTCRSSRRP
jgi:urea transport system permease protein